MSRKLTVTGIADNLKSSKKPKFLTPIFKKLVVKKFKNLKNGCIDFTDCEQLIMIGNKQSKLRVKLEVKSQEFYVLLGSGGLMGASEAYALGFWKADDLVKLIQIMVRNKDLMNNLDSGLSSLIKPLNKWIHYRRQNTLLGSKKNILAHYDLSNDFYQLWLDNTMTYSCGIFKDENTTLEEASIEKLDQICKKLNLKSTDSILEIGTGWGSFAIHAAKNYGCSVTTTTISDAQYKFAKQRIKDENLSNKINLLNKDYRYLEGKFDKIASIEMIEAVGHKNVPEYFKKVSSLLNEDGTFVMQGITYNDQNFEVYKNSVDFINKYIFPGSCLISINQVSEIIKINTDMIFKDLEDITEHYATTLKIWRTNFFDKISEIRDLGFSQEFINLWEFYFVYCEAGFIEKNIGDYQFVFSKKQGLK
jgi:cyclopropane-fatty-acyl-phospholipid synthase